MQGETKGKSAWKSPSRQVSHLNDRSIAPTNQMEFIHNEEWDVLHILALLPPPGQHVPVLRGGDDNVSLLQQLQVGCCFSHKLHHIQAQASKLGTPIHKALGCEARHGSDVDTPRCALALSCLHYKANPQRLRDFKKEENSATSIMSSRISAYLSNLEYEAIGKLKIQC